MQNAGVYILQWHNQDDPGEFLPSISGHKAQLMYFYETLSSVHYRYFFLQINFHIICVTHKYTCII